jgi:AcrR family transcriptional regulator
LELVRRGVTPQGAATTLGGSAVATADARERLLRTAYDLFSIHGIQAIGVDRIVAESGVAKTTLYRHFRSKDELALAVIERREEHWSRDWLQAEALARGHTGEERLLVLFDILAEWARRDDFEGCLFMNTLLEMRDHASPVALASSAALGHVRAFLRELAESVGVRDAGEFALWWQTLMWGAIVAASFGEPDAALGSREVAKLLLEREQSRLA